MFELHYHSELEDSHESSGLLASLKYFTLKIIASWCTKYHSAILSQPTQAVFTCRKKKREMLNYLKHIANYSITRKEKQGTLVMSVVNPASQ